MIFNYFLILVVLLLLAGLGIDGGIFEWRYMQMSFAARAAATAAALALQRGGSSATVTSAGQTAAALNGFTNGANNVGVAIQNPPTAGTYQGNSYSVRCVVTQAVGTAFMALVGFRTVSMTSTYDVGGATPVSMASAFNINAIFTDSTSVTNGGFGNASYAFSANALGTVRAGNNLGALISWRGNLFTLGVPNSVNGVDNATISLTKSSFSQLLMLASASYGPQSNVSFVITYTDGSTATTTLTMSDWCRFNGSYSNEVLVEQTAYRDYKTSGASYSCMPNIYGYTINLNKSKVVQSLTAPNTRSVVVLALDLIP